MPNDHSHKVRVWDLPTRLFHWLLAASAVGMLVTAKIGGNALEWHARLGYCIGALLMFRLLWGVAGGHWSRFVSFPPSPSAAWVYLRASHLQRSAGHNPLGALSIYAMLLGFTAQVASGLFSATKDDFAGPLSVLVSNPTAHALTGYHKNIGQSLLIALVVLHLVAIAWHAWHGRNLVAPMISGDAKFPGDVPASRDDASSRLRALALLALCSLAMWGIVWLGG